MTKAIVIQPREWGSYIKMDAEFKVTVTPEFAMFLLENWNDHNVSLSEHRAKKLADIMSAGKWQPTKTPIQIRTDGHLLDGQTRLRAVVICGMSRPFFFAFGVPPEAFVAIDTGRTRHAKEGFEIRKIPNAKDISRIVRTIDLIHARTEGARHLSLSIEDALALYDTLHAQHLQDARREVKRIMPSRYCIETCTMAGLYYCFAAKSPLQAKTFFEVWATGSTPRAGAPYQLNQLLPTAVYGNGHTPSHKRLCVIVSAWNEFVVGKKFTPTDVANATLLQNIPVVKGPNDREAA